MEVPYWQKQIAGKPLFPDLLWSRPENKLHAGKLLIIGGNQYGFSAPAEAYQAASKAGIGVCKVLLPDALRKTVGQHMETAEFAASTPSGSFSRQAMGELLNLAAWSDGVLLAGDLGKNSETAILLESFTQKYTSQLTVTKDAVDYYTNSKLLLQRPQTTLVLSLAQLQKLAQTAGSTTPVTFDMGLLQLIDFLHNFTKMYTVHIVVKHLENMLVAVSGEVSTTKLTEDQAVWRVKTASNAAVWWLQHPEQVFEAITVAIL